MLGPYPLRLPSAPLIGVVVGYRAAGFSRRHCPRFRRAQVCWAGPRTRARPHGGQQALNGAIRVVAVSGGETQVPIINPAAGFDGRLR